MRAPARKIELGFDPGKLKAIRRPAAPAPRLTKDRLPDTKDVRRGGHVASLGHRSDLGNAVESPAGSLAFGNAKRCYCFSTYRDRAVASAWLDRKSTRLNSRP